MRSLSRKRPVAAFLVHLSALFCLGELHMREQGAKSPLISTVLAAEAAGQRPRGLTTLFALPGALSSVDRRLATPPGNFPFARTTEPSPTERFRADALWAVTQCICIGRSIDPSLVTSRQEIGDFLRQLDKRKDPDSPLMKGWRRAALGEPLLNLLNGGGKVSLDWNGGALRTL